MLIGFGKKENLNLFLKQQDATDEQQDAADEQQDATDE